MELRKILTGLENFKSKGDLDIDITKVIDDSRKVFTDKNYDITIIDKK